VEGCILRQDGLESSQTLKRTISFLKEIGCTIDPNVATNACYEGVLFELVCSRDYSEYLKGIHAKPKNCEKTTIVENVVGLERTGGGGVVAAFTYGDTNVLFKTNMIYMFKRVEVSIDKDRNNKRLTLGELFKLIDEDVPLAGLHRSICTVLPTSGAYHCDLCLYSLRRV